MLLRPAVLCIGLPCLLASYSISEFLTTATFGPTRASLREFASAYDIHDSRVTAHAIDAWVSDQVSLPASSHRAYYRERSNPRVDGLKVQGDIYGPCDVGSRWHPFAFTKQDEGHIIELSKRDNKISAKIGGVLRTEIDAARLRLQGTQHFLICSVEEEVGGKVEIARDGACDGFTFSAQNPGISFSVVDTTTTRVFSPRDARLAPIPHVDAMILTEMNSVCEFPVGQAADAFMGLDGQFYKFDPRLRLHANPSSPYEVANQPLHGHRYHTFVKRTEGETDPQALDWAYRHEAGKSLVWTNVVLNADDQLRQRIAWALAQLCTASESGLIGEHKRFSETWLHFYDIFVRHAFGNFRDILREVAFSPVMGHYLTYLHNRAFASTPTPSNTSVFPDENMAREVMQLFTIGTTKLHADGTPVLTDGQSTPTYTNKDILAFSRVWTGFTLAPGRGNAEGYDHMNIIDPMVMEEKYHDTLPKTKLDGGYLGDGFPLCSDLGFSSATDSPACVHLAFPEHVDRMQVQVHSSGMVNVVREQSRDPWLAPDTGNTFHVHWEGGEVPVAGRCGLGCKEHGKTCLCDTRVVTSPVFDAVPSLQDTKALATGAPDPRTFPPGTYVRCKSAQCTRSELSVYLRDGVFDEHTIFQLPAEHAGAAPIFMANKESMVHVGDEFKFRDPPCFLPSEVDGSRREQDSYGRTRSAVWEVEALLDHLFYHPNTAPFVARHLLQRMSASNPSARAVAVVSEAFRSGTSNGRVFSGEYGDLGAAVHALLLLGNSDYNILHSKSMREPLLKIMNAVRSLEYKTADGREVMIDHLDVVIGQEAFHAPTVFGFYSPDYSPEGPLREAGLVAPEAEILTTSTLFNSLNGLSYLIGGQDGLQFTLQPMPGANAEEVVEELDDLLTLGKMAQETKGLLARGYQNLLRDPRSAFQWLLNAFFLSPDFHTTDGSVSTGVARPRAPPRPASGNPATQYKAVVVINLQGGCDSYNVMVPHSGCHADDGTSHDLHREYIDQRGDLAIPKSQLLPIDVQDQPCDTFGLHPSLSNVQNMYQDGDAAFIANVGALVEPVDNTNMEEKSTPPSLFAHNTMSRAAQTVHADDAWADGVVGRLASLVTSGEHDRTNFYSLAGKKKMLQGAEQVTHIVDPKDGIPGYAEEAALGSTIEHLTSTTRDSPFAETYVQALDRAMESKEMLGELLDDTQLLTQSLGHQDTKLAMQLAQAAKLIKIDREHLGTERAVFVTEMGGFDTHNDDDGQELSALLAELDGALGGFREELLAQRAWDDVTVVTISEFGRTLTSNGHGSDHGWAGNQLVLGGGVKGGVLGQYPDRLGEASPYYLPRGRLIPSTSWEGMWSPLMEWFGVPEDAMGDLLPNLDRFPEGQIIPQSAMFTMPTDADDPEASDPAVNWMQWLRTG